MTYHKTNIANIKTIENIDENVMASLEPRDAFYDIIKKINDKEFIGKAIAIAGLRRTGKSILLSQLHLYSDQFGVKQEEILHITLSATLHNKEVSRDNLDFCKVCSSESMVYPTLDDLAGFINLALSERKIKCILIDEITLCKDLILAGKGFVDYLVNRGIIVILAGTESLALKLAHEESLYSRLISIDINYISFAEYCKVKRLNTDTVKNRRDAFERYIRQGNILDDTIAVDDLYVESAVGVNVALSILNADFEEFIGMEEREKELTQAIIKYTRLIGERITVDTVKSQITRADITRAISNENARRKRDNAETLNMSKGMRDEMALKSIEEIFKKYNMEFGISKIQLSHEQLQIIDKSFTKMGLIYNLSIIPCKPYSNGSVNAEDIFAMHSFIYHIVQGLVSYIQSAELDMPDEDIETLLKNIESAAMGRIIEGIVALHYIRKVEKERPLNICIRNYANGQFEVERKCTKPRLYKYNNLIDSDGEAAKAEIDLVVSEPDAIRLIEIKRSAVTDPAQVRWLHNETVIQEIRNKISQTKAVVKEVYYLGEDTTVDDITYRNIPGMLLEEIHR